MGLRPPRVTLFSCHLSHRSLRFVVDPLFSRSLVLCFSVMSCSCFRVICVTCPLAYSGVLLSCSLVLCKSSGVLLFPCHQHSSLAWGHFGCNFARQMIMSSCPFVFSEKTSSGEGAKASHLTLLQYLILLSLGIAPSDHLHRLHRSLKLITQRQRRAGG